MSARPLDLAGQPFGRLRAIRSLSERRGRQVMWLCVCAPDLGGCGRTTSVRATCLRRGDTASCGCIRGENNRRRAKIDIGLADQIRRRVAAGELQSDLAKQYGVSRQSVCQIVHGHTHVRHSVRGAP